MLVFWICLAGVGRTLGFGLGFGLGFAGFGLVGPS